MTRVPVGPVVGAMTSSDAPGFGLPPKRPVKVTAKLGAASTATMSHQLQTGQPEVQVEEGPINGAPAITAMAWGDSDSESESEGTNAT